MAPRPLQCRSFGIVVVALRLNQCQDLLRNWKPRASIAKHIGPCVLAQIFTKCSATARAERVP